MKRLPRYTCTHLHAQDSLLKDPHEDLTRPWMTWPHPHDRCWMDPLQTFVRRPMTRDEAAAFIAAINKGNRALFGWAVVIYLFLYNKLWSPTISCSTSHACMAGTKAAAA